MGDGVGLSNLTYCLSSSLTGLIPGHVAHALAVATARADLLAVLVIEIDEEPFRRRAEARKAGLCVYA
jgi:proteasome assembly chaperone (PAC2) family protein